MGSSSRTWYGIAAKADWIGPADVKEQFGPNVDFLKDNRLVFDLGGNKYRLVVRVA
jgi:mRNA interferase HigB